ncbi:hypothetical protein DCC81_24775 [Chitinophaga parva]|uniref:DUF3168 domain-containing protein n=1 Tax=Chitinophaga parva TaxID=2169414 RepID=A0A2T7BBN5_9BACT|nr:DUF3168 domain-containing protein [Chitinophaga parva]PUZ21805.1 hypothetical protein DCC81_24775 [Chitinophaga parva]
MIDVNYLVRRAYFQKLNGALLYNGAPVPIYDRFAINSAVAPYVILSSQTDTEEGTKNNQGHDATILVDIVNRGEAISSMVVDSIAGQVLALINPLHGWQALDLGPDLQLLRTTKISDQPLEAQSNTEKVIRRLMRFRHIIHEKTI